MSAKTSHSGARPQIRSVVIALTALAAAAAAGAALNVAGVSVIAASAPYDALPVELGTVAGLFARNTRVALWPLALIALGWPRTRVARRVGDALIAGQLLAHGATVGCALAQHPELWRYLPHLPVEWLAITLPVAAWLTARRRPGRPRLRGLAMAAAAVSGLLAIAAVLETYAVPL